MASKHVLRSMDTLSGDFSMQSLTSCYVPDDLMMNILPRLPVKSLLRFKTVSKHWLSLISDPAFVNSHLRRALENDESLLFHRTVDFHNSIAFRHVDSSIDLPLFEGDLVRDLFIVGSYNGIVCFASNDRLNSVYSGRIHNRYILGSSDYGNFSITLQIYLWNPATKKSNLLPSPHCQGKAFTTYSYVGFGFDPIANDFKVVRFTDKHAMVYTTSTNAWKEIQRPEKFPMYSICDACMNGVLYWTWVDGVIRYDLNNEVFYINKFSADARGGLVSEYRIMEMKDSIAVIMYQNNWEELKSDVFLWTVDDGFERSWTLRYSFDVASVVDWVHGYINNNGDILFKTSDGEWLLHNLDQKETKNVTVPVGTIEVFKHIESLVPITGSGSKEFEMLMKGK